MKTICILHACKLAHEMVFKSANILSVPIVCHSIILSDIKEPPKDLKLLMQSCIISTDYPG